MKVTQYMFSTAYHGKEGHFLGDFTSLSVSDTDLMFFQFSLAQATWQWSCFSFWKMGLWKGRGVGEQVPSETFSP